MTLTSPGKKCFLISSMISLAASFKALQTLSARTSSHTMTLTSPGKKCFLISSMISLALVIPLAMIPLMTFITSAILTFNFAATSAILSQMSLERASVHLKFLAISISLAWTILKISLALVTPFAIASRIILSTSAALILNISAASRNFLHISAERTSSQVMTLMSSPSTPGKKCFLIASMISLALVIPFTTKSLMNASTLAASTLIRAAISWILAQIPSSKTSVHLKLCTICSIFARTNAMISLALVNPLSRASRTALSTSSILIFKILAASLKALQTLSARTSSHTMTFSISWAFKWGKKWCLIFSMISLIFVIPLTTNFLMNSSTFLTSTLTFSAISWILAHTSAARTSVHLKLCTKDSIFARTNLMISLALVNPLSRASRMALSTSATLIFNILAASFKALQTLSARTSSQVMVLITAEGKKCFFNSSMISLSLVIPLETSTFINSSTCSILIDTLAATSAISEQTYSGRMDPQWKSVAISMSCCRT